MHRHLVMLVGIVLGLSASARAQVVELHSMKTRLAHELRLKAWSRSRIDVDWKAASAIQVARDLSNRLLVAIVPSEGVRRGVEAKELPLVDLSLPRCPVLAALELVSARTGLRFVDHGRTLRLALPEEVFPEATVRMYSVHELTFVIRDFAPPIGFDLHRSSQEAEEAEELATRTVSGFDEPGLADLVRRMTPAEWWGREDVSIDAGRGVLIVRQTPKAHRAIEGLLRDLGG